MPSEEILLDPRSFIIYGLCAVVVALYQWLRIEREGRDRQDRESASSILEVRVTLERAKATIEARDDQRGELRRQLERCEAQRDSCHDRERQWWQQGQRQ